MDKLVTTPISRMIDAAVSCVKCGKKGLFTCDCWINLECPKCGTRKTTERLETDHPKSKKVLITCPECDNGDFGETIYLDANGKHLTDDYMRKETT